MLRASACRRRMRSVSGSLAGASASGAVLLATTASDADMAIPRLSLGGEPPPAPGNFGRVGQLPHCRRIRIGWNPVPQPFRLRAGVGTGEAMIETWILPALLGVGLA